MAGFSRVPIKLSYRTTQIFLVKLDRKLKKREREANCYWMPHFFVILTIMKITKATMMKVIKATKKLPIPNT